MIRTCEDCQVEYDDANCFTFCPHPLLMPENDMERKIKAISLFDSRKKVQHKTDPDIVGKVIAVGYNGYINIEGQPWEKDFDAMNFEIVEG